MSSFRSAHRRCLPIAVVMLVGHRCRSCGHRWPLPGCTAHVQNSRARVFDRRGAVGWGRGGRPHRWLIVSARGSPIEPSSYPSSSCGLRIVLIPLPCRHLSFPPHQLPLALSAQFHLLSSIPSSSSSTPTTTYFLPPPCHPFPLSSLSIPPLIVVVSSYWPPTSWFPPPSFSVFGSSVESVRARPHPFGKGRGR